jgi:flagellin
MITPVNQTASFQYYSQTTSASKQAQSSMSSMSRGVKSTSNAPSQTASSERIRAQLKALQAARQNMNNAASAIQTGDSWMQSMTENFGRMKQLAVRANDGTMSDTDIKNLNTEFQQLQQANTQIVDTASFNGKKLLQGDFSDQTVQTGANSGETINVNIEDLTTLKVNDTTSLQEVMDSDRLRVDSENAISQLSDSIDKMSDLRADMGGQLTRLQNSAEATLDYEKNLRSAESQIRDVDMAKESTNLASAQILSETSNAMLAQQNSFSNSGVNQSA